MTSFHKIRRATDEDVFFILMLEKDPANIFVHSSDAETHHANLHDKKHHYLIAENGERASLGYAILVEGENGRLEWKRIIVARRGDGIGSAFMAAVLNYVFNEGLAETVWLDVYEKNDRARHVYKKLGFIETGEDLEKVPGERLVIMERARR